MSCLLLGQCRDDTGEALAQLAIRGKGIGKPAQLKTNRRTTAKAQHPPAASRWVRASQSHMFQTVPMV